MTQPDDRYRAFMGMAPKRIPHWEHWSCPDAETYITGIDYYDHPRLCRQKLLEMYPQLKDSLGVPKNDTPKPRPRLSNDGQSSDSEKHSVRWGDGETWTFEHGEKFFKSAEDVLNFSPLEHAAEFKHWPVVSCHDFSSEELLYQDWRKNYPPEWTKAPEGSSANVGFYNTMFMWPLLCFGWELFMETCLEPGFERIMDEFAEINRRVFRAFARLPVNFVVCHDDIVNTRGPICSPKWMRKYIFPRYEEFWGIVKAAGKEVLFMVDGRINDYADDVLACGARGFITEPYTDFKAIARKHKDVFLAGEGDNRVLTHNRPEGIRAMVESMVETSKMTGGYMMCIGNHIPWDIPPAAVKLYLDLCAELGDR
jgi:hypothetical protein